MANISVTIDSKNFDRWIDKAPQNIHTAISNSIRKITLLVERGAKINSPVDTGRLRSSISTDIYPFSATVSTHVNYAIYVHDGTRYMRARPFMLQAAESVQNQVNDIVSEELKVLE